MMVRLSIRSSSTGHTFKSGTRVVIVGYLKSRVKYYMHIQDKNKFDKISYRNETFWGKVMK
jgi:hypothetical protein